MLSTWLQTVEFDGSKALESGEAKGKTVPGKTGRYGGY